ncbi:MAG: hypothetical protein ACTHNP_05235 [Solirubrobacterales bacterium]
MKYLKTLGLAALAAMALTASIGASSASATVLCKTALKEGCAASGWDYPAGTEIDISLVNTTSTSATSGELLDTCTEGTSKGSTANTGSSSETIAWSLSVFTSSTCTHTTDTIANGSLEVHWISGGTEGTVTVKGTQATKVILGGTSCTYGAGAEGVDLGKLTGGSPATLHVETALPKLAGSFICPGDVVWKGSYVVTSPQPLYVSAS